MAVSFKVLGTAVNGESGSFAPSYGAGLAANDLSVLTVAYRTDSGGARTLDLPSGWTPAANLAFRAEPWYMVIQTFFKVGSFSGAITPLTFTGLAPSAAPCAAHITSFQCGGSETWDLNTRATMGWETNIPDWVDLNFTSGCYANLTDWTNPPMGVTTGDYVQLIGLYGQPAPAYSTRFETGSGTTQDSFSNNIINYYMNDGIGLRGAVLEMGASITGSTGAQGAAHMYFKSPGIGYTPAAGLVQRLGVQQRTSSDTRVVIDTLVSGGRTESDVCTSVDASSLRSNVAVPYSRRWRDGETPTAHEVSPDQFTDLNLNWRSPLRWILGYDKPAFKAYSTDTTLWTIQWNAIPMNTEIYKKGGIIHATDDSKVYVPEDGWYEGIYSLGLEALAGHGVTTWDAPGISRNGGHAYSLHYHPHFGSGSPMSRVAGANPFKIYLLAGDYIELRVWVTVNSQSRNWVFGGSNHTNSVLEFWWSGR
jgi:hypothetical protein